MPLNEIAASQREAKFREEKRKSQESKASAVKDTADVEDRQTRNPWILK